jgi:hypothetical protein
MISPSFAKPMPNMPSWSKRANRPARFLESKPLQSQPQALARRIASTAAIRREARVSGWGRKIQGTRRIASNDLNLPLELANDEHVAKSGGSRAVRALWVAEFDVR